MSKPKQTLASLGLSSSFFVALLIAMSTSPGDAIAQTAPGSNYSNVTISELAGWVYSDITISGAPANAVVTTVDVTFSCVHSYGSDLVIDVGDFYFSPYVTVWNHEGGSAPNPYKTVTGITSFAGMPVNGTWSLRLRDDVELDEGYLDYWLITVHYAAPSFAVYGAVTQWSPGADADGDGYYETYSFKIGIDGDVTVGSATVWGKATCITTGLSRWTDFSWTISGTPVDYEEITFTNTDFAGQFTGNRSLDFKVELWDQNKSTKLAEDFDLYSEALLKVDDYSPPYIWDTPWISGFSGNVDSDADGCWEDFEFNILIDADVASGSSNVAARIYCNTCTPVVYWPTEPWAISGISFDPRSFNFTEADFTGRFTGNRQLDFSVELWNPTFTVKYDAEATVDGEPVCADDFVAGPPSTPTGFTVCDEGDGFVKLCWNANPEPSCTGYKIYWYGLSSVSTSTYDGVQTVSNRLTTTATVSPLLNFHFTGSGSDYTRSYYFIIVATNATQQSAPTSRIAGQPRESTVPDYTNGEWEPADGGNYDNVNYTDNSIWEDIVIHTTQAALYTSTKNAFQNPTHGVAAHFVVDVDGSVYQFIHTNDKGRHVAGCNTGKIGVEHVGIYQDYEVNGYPDAMLRGSAQLVADLCWKLAISASRTHIKGHDEYSGVSPCTSTHTDPGDWPWVTYMAYVQAFYTDVDDEETVIPAESELGTNYPNPFNFSTLINYKVGRPGHLSLGIYNALGQRIRTLASGMHAGGLYTVGWDGRNQRGEEVSSGTYFYVLKEQGGKVWRGKMLFLK